MTESLSIAMIVVLDVAIVAAILALLVWGLVAHRRDVRRLEFVERRRGVDRRRMTGRVATHQERRRDDRRASRPVASLRTG
jgi:hypothetical protein